MRGGEYKEIPAGVPKAQPKGTPETKCWYFSVLLDLSQGTDIIQFMKVMKLQPQPEQKPCQNLEDKKHLDFFLVWLNNKNSNSFSSSILYSHRNSHSYGMAISSIIAGAKAKFIPKIQLPAILKTKAIPKDWTGIQISNWGLVGRSQWQMIFLYQENVFP